LDLKKGVAEMTDREYRMPFCISEDVEVEVIYRCVTPGAAAITSGPAENWCPETAPEFEFDAMTTDSDGNMVDLDLLPDEDLQRLQRDIHDDFADQDTGPDPDDARDAAFDREMRERE
jgi:hypothetical protein